MKGLGAGRYFEPPVFSRPQGMRERTWQPASIPSIQGRANFLPTVERVNGWASAWGQIGGSIDPREANVISLPPGASPDASYWNVNNYDVNAVRPNLDGKCPLLDCRGGRWLFMRWPQAEAEQAFVESNDAIEGALFGQVSRKSRVPGCSAGALVISARGMPSLRGPERA